MRGRPLIRARKPMIRRRFAFGVVVFNARSDARVSSRRAPVERVFRTPPEVLDGATHNSFVNVEGARVELTLSPRFVWLLSETRALVRRFEATFSQTDTNVSISPFPHLGTPGLPHGRVLPESQPVGAPSMNLERSAEKVFRERTVGEDRGEQRPARDWHRIETHLSRSVRDRHVQRSLLHRRSGWAREFVRRTLIFASQARQDGINGHGPPARSRVRLLPADHALGNRGKDRFVRWEMTRLNLVSPDFNHVAAGGESEVGKVPARPMPQADRALRPERTFRQDETAPLRPAAAEPRSVREVERRFRAPEPVAPPVAAPPSPSPKPAQAAPPQIDIADLDDQLWRRFEKRIRIENERRGR